MFSPGRSSPLRHGLCNTSPSSSTTFSPPPGQAHGKPRQPLQSDTSPSWIQPRAAQETGFNDSREHPADFIQIHWQHLGKKNTTSNWWEFSLVFFLPHLSGVWSEATQPVLPKQTCSCTSPQRLSAGTRSVAALTTIPRTITGKTELVAKTGEENALWNGTSRTPHTTLPCYNLSEIGRTCGSPACPSARGLQLMSLLPAPEHGMEASRA